MKNIKQPETRYYPEEQLVTTHLVGEISEPDLKTWKKTLANALNRVPDHGRFKLLVNLDGFRAAGLDVHKKFRTILPCLLAGYGYRIGYLDLFPEAKVSLRQTRGIRCVAMANVHHDATKMKDYHDRFSCATEDYFTDLPRALNWIRNVPA